MHHCHYSTKDTRIHEKACVQCSWCFPKSILYSYTKLRPGILLRYSKFRVAPAEDHPPIQHHFHQPNYQNLKGSTKPEKCSLLWGTVGTNAIIFCANFAYSIFLPVSLCHRHCLKPYYHFIGTRNNRPTSLNGAKSRKHTKNGS